ncbi:site-specific integrase [Pseudomonas coronafaciens]|uniref:Tyrosine-type recombinase/integrase n=1 Tax=Pseudomonas coronafaciens pv. coronafaciens TaxID=235275 RepID=A0AAE6UM09_9PSED|nr:site-specific integrase [Pseudomonas coronafaciens]QGT80906.1 tyrosine-type recombinase/integrase [Pseudomonas coronafaciens pv. coronafaciens]
MTAADRYLKAARRESTTRRYQQAIKHFENEWGGLLPASSEGVVRYLADHAEQLSSNTLRTHLAALAQWHKSHGFIDPTKAPKVRDVLRGIHAEHPRPVKKAEAMQLQALEACIEGLQAQVSSGSACQQLRARRDRALILLGFWRAFRADELCGLRVEHIKLRSAEGLELFLASSKTDREHQGRTVAVPALKRLCPVQAYEEWLQASDLKQGPLFRSIDRWGHLGVEALNPNSISRLLRLAFARNGLVGEGYSGHSLRRGFATWATRNDWGTKALMDYVGWRDVASAMRYIDNNAFFGEWAR